MIFSTAALALSLLSLAISHPVEKRDALPPVNSMMDESVAQLALYLEHLELSLYTGGYENFTDAEYTAQGFPPGFRENVGVIAQVCMLHPAPLCRTLLIVTSTKQHTHKQSLQSSVIQATPPSLHAPTNSITPILHLSSI